MNIYEIHDEILALEAILEDAGESADESIRAAIDGLQMDMATKIDNLHRYYRNLVARADGLSTEATRLADVAKATTNKANRIKDYLKMAVELQGGKVGTGIGNLSVVNAGGKQSLHVGDDLPSDWTKEVVTVKPDTDRIREALESGQEVPGAFLIPRGRVLRGA